MCSDAHSITLNNLVLDTTVVSLSTLFIICLIAVITFHDVLYMNRSAVQVSWCTIYEQVCLASFMMYSIWTGLPCKFHDVLYMNRSALQVSWCTIYEQVCLASFLMYYIWTGLPCKFHDVQYMNRSALQVSWCTIYEQVCLASFLQELFIKYEP